MSKRPFTILGVSALYHDSAACLIQDGEIIAAAQEERFTRRKGDARLPIHAMKWCLTEGNVSQGGIDLVIFFEKPLTKLLRLLRTHTAVAPQGLRSFLMGVPLWLKEKGWSPAAIERFLVQEGFGRPHAFEFCEHHLSHAASAFYPSPFTDAAILTIDGVGEWTTSAISVGEGHQLRMIYEQRFPHSLGMLYSAFTYFTGFKVNSGEYKLMGLAPYGEPTYVDTIKTHLIDLRADGSFRLNMKYFGYLGGLKMTNHRFAQLFDGPPRAPESPLTTREMNLARSIQVVTEEIVLNMARYARAVTGKVNLCLAGGVALNCVANGKLQRSNIFDKIWIQPAAGDAGGALGAALYAWHAKRQHPRVPLNGQSDGMSGAFLGPSFSNTSIEHYLTNKGYPYERLSTDEWPTVIANEVANNKVVGLFQGKMEFGPRALCARSILADARSPETQSYLNLATKFRESFRPFAPVVLQEDASLFFEEIDDSPYMLLVDQVKSERLTHVPRPKMGTDLRVWVNTPRSDVPAITHVDHSARIQTVDQSRNPKMHQILTAFKAQTGIGLMVNTSFNVRSEPIVCTPEDAYVCFMRTGMDTLILEDCILRKENQPMWEEAGDWRENYEMD